MSDPLPPPHAELRRRIGVAVLLLGLIFVAVTVAALVNPWRLVGLRQHFADPIQGIVGTVVFALVGTWLALPVRSSAVDRGRARLRTVLIALTAAGVIIGGWDLDQQWFRFQPSVVAHDPHSRRVLVQVTTFDGVSLHMFEGTGFLARDLGDFGSPCGLGVVAEFGDANHILIDTEYGKYQLGYDPATGAPIDHVPTSCTV